MIANVFNGEICEAEANLEKVKTTIVRLDRGRLMVLVESESESVTILINPNGKMAIVHERDGDK